MEGKVCVRSLIHKPQHAQHRTTIQTRTSHLISYYKFLYNEMKSDEELRDSANLLHHMSAAVLPESDPVTSVDTQVGMVQMIKCDVVEQAMQNSCHMLEGTICSLLKSCGDPRGRFRSCEFRFGVGGVIRETAKVITSERI